MKKLLLILFWPSLLLAQKDMSSARPEIRKLLGDIQGLQYSNAAIDTAWARAVPIVALSAGILIPKQDTITTAAGTDQYALNGDFFRIRSVWRGSGTNRTPIQIVDDPYSLEQVGSSIPSEFCWVHGSRLFVFPVPTGVEKLYVFYYADPILAFATDTATSDLPKSLRQAVVWDAAAQLTNLFGQHDLSFKYHERSGEIIEKYRRLISIEGDRPSEPQK